ncbi:hypothetical protein FRC00_009137 [Tulasnella sp. 408]|nr:hypothetical protein FRC00_009137 [Tulasnella sp. 408]
MLGLAWATLPEASLERERKGVILVGIAMVLIWSGLAKGDAEYCAILVCINSLLQIVLFSPYALLFVNILGSNPGSTNPLLHLKYSHVSTSVGIYLGIPLAAGVITRFTLKRALKPARFASFLKWFGPVALLGLLYTIIVLFANQELAIAVAIANYGTESPEALAATIGPLVEVSVDIAHSMETSFIDYPTYLIQVPVLLALTYLALWLRTRLRWTGEIVLE